MKPFKNAQYTQTPILYDTIFIKDNELKERPDLTTQTNLRKVRDKAAARVSKKHKPQSQESQKMKFGDHPLIRNGENVKIATHQSTK